MLRNKNSHKKIAEKTSAKKKIDQSKLGDNPVNESCTIEHNDDIIVKVSSTHHNNFTPSIHSRKTTCIMNSGIKKILGDTSKCTMKNLGKTRT